MTAAAVRAGLEALARSALDSAALAEPVASAALPPLPQKNSVLP